MRDLTKFYNPMPIHQLSQLNPNIPWLEYLNTVLLDTVRIIIFGLLLELWMLLSITEHF